MRVLVLKNGMTVLSFARCPHTPPPDPRFWGTPRFWDYECLDLGWVWGYKVLADPVEAEEWI